MASIFWNWKEVFLVDFMEQGTTTKEVYSKTMSSPQSDPKQTKRNQMLHWSMRMLNRTESKTFRKNLPGKFSALHFKGRPSTKWFRHLLCHQMIRPSTKKELPPKNFRMLSRHLSSLTPKKLVSRWHEYLNCFGDH